MSRPAFESISLPATVASVRVCFVGPEYYDAGGYKLDPARFGLTSITGVTCERQTYTKDASSWRAGDLCKASGCTVSVRTADDGVYLIFVSDRQRMIPHAFAPTTDSYDGRDEYTGCLSWLRFYVVVTGTIVGES